MSISLILKYLPWNDLNISCGTLYQGGVGKWLYTFSGIIVDLLLRAKLLRRSDYFPRVFQTREINLLPKCCLTKIGWSESPDTVDCSEIWLTQVDMNVQPLKTKMTSWKITIFLRLNTSPFMVDFPAGYVFFAFFVGAILKKNRISCKWCLRVISTKIYPA